MIFEVFIIILLLFLIINTLQNSNSKSLISNTEGLEDETLKEVKKRMKNKKIIPQMKSNDFIKNKTSDSGGKLVNKVSRNEKDDEMMSYINRPNVDDEIDKQRHMKLQENITKLYMNDVVPGDDRLYKKEQHISIKNKRALDAKAKYDKNSLVPWVSQELNDAENSRWWDCDALAFQT